MASVSAPVLGSGPSGSAPLPDRPRKSDYILTSARDYVSRSSDVRDATNLVARGKSVVEADVVVRGDFGAPVHLGRYCRVERGAVLSPTIVPRTNDPTLSTSDGGEGDGERGPPGPNERGLPLVIGSHTRIGPGTRVHSVSIGSSVRIGANCTLSPRSRVHDCCVIEDGTVVPPDMVVPPFSRVRGAPGRIVGSLPECCGGEFADERVREYLSFVKGLED
ncbi:hypothetical protein ACHAWF_014949 [Thalassiosira exigua]